MGNEYDIKRCMEHEAVIKAVLKSVNDMREEFKQFNKMFLVGNGQEALSYQINLNSNHRKTSDEREESNRRMWRGSAIMQITNLIGIAGVLLAMYKIWSGQ